MVKTNPKHRILSLVLAVILSVASLSLFTVGAGAAEVQEESTETVEATTETSEEKTEDFTVEEVTNVPDEEVVVIPKTKEILPSGAKGDKVYLKNEANWSRVYCYMWQKTNDDNNNKGWPGEALENIGDDVWSYDVNGADWDMIIFNGGGSPQTNDMVYPGDSYIFNNKTNAWSIYDTNPLQIRDLTTDIKSPQFKDMDITISADVRSEAEIMYKFTAETGGVSKVIQDFSKKSTVVWTPDVVGTYTITLDVKDTAGEENSRSISYEIKDDSKEVRPIIKKVLPRDGSQIEASANTNVMVTAGGGNVGTNLLFYKYIIKDSTGATVNVPYYTKNNQYTFKANRTGEYTVEVYVQGSDNSTVKKDYNYQSVGVITDPDLEVGSFTESGTPVVNSKLVYEAKAYGGKAPYTYQFTINGDVVQGYSSKASYDFTPTKAGSYVVEVAIKDSTGEIATSIITTKVTDAGGTDVLKGDTNGDGIVNVRDVTLLQKYLVDEVSIDQIIIEACDTNEDGTINIRDATYMQRYIAGCDVEW